MRLFFVDENNKAFYESDTMGFILLFVNSTQFPCALSREQHRLSIVIENVKSVETALAFMHDLELFCKQRSIENAIG